MLKKTLKYVLLGLCGALLAAAIVLAYLAGKDSRRTIRCEGVDIVILDSMKNSFVSENDVRAYLDKEYGRYKDEAIDSIDLVKIEKIIDGRSAVLKSHAYVTRDGILHIDVTQRRPIVRFQKNDGGFYADKDGFIFPLQRSFASHVQIIDGKIPLAANSGYKGAIADPKEKEWFDRIMEIVNFIEKDRTWKDKIVQISVREDGDLILIPREGRERFLFGQPEDVEEKFSKMEKYYTHILPAKGEGHYRTVDLKYKGQIVCREK
jgi:cell division protein FtsQ